MYGEIVAAAVVKVADTRYAHMIAFNERPRHDGNLRTPVPIARGSNGEPPGNDPEHQRDCHCRHAPPARQPERPDRERRKRHRQSQPQSGPRQIRKIDGERGPCDDDNLDQKLDSSDQPAEQRRHEAATSNQWILLNVNSTAASAVYVAWRLFLAGGRKLVLDLNESGL